MKGNRMFGVPICSVGVGIHFSSSINNILYNIAANLNYIVWAYGELPHSIKYVTTIGNIFLKEKMQQNM